MASTNWDALGKGAGLWSPPPWLVALPVMSLPLSVCSPSLPSSLVEILFFFLVEFLREGGFELPGLGNSSDSCSFANSCSPHYVDSPPPPLLPRPPLRDRPSPSSRDRCHPCFVRLDHIPQDINPLEPFCPVPCREKDWKVVAGFSTLAHH